MLEYPNMLNSQLCFEWIKVGCSIAFASQHITHYIMGNAGYKKM